LKEEEYKKVKITKTLSCEGQTCPGPLIDTKIGISTIPVGEVMEIVTSDETSCGDIQIWAEKIGHEFLGCYDDGMNNHLLVRRNK
jgi:tRNA 2-thiouridine synthesizing protein A